MDVKPASERCEECGRLVLKVYQPGFRWSRWMLVDDEVYLQGFTLRPTKPGENEFEAVLTPTYRVHECTAVDRALHRGRDLYDRYLWRKYLAENGYRVPPRDQYPTALRVACPLRRCGAEAGERCFNLSSGKKYRETPKLAPHTQRLEVAYWVDGYELFRDPRYRVDLLRRLETAGRN